MSVFPLGNSAQSGDAGLTLLLTMAGFWDATSYSGSGNLLNQGTAGSSGDMIPGASTAAPTFASGKFTFDGVNDTMMTAGDVSTFGAPAPSAGAFSFGVIVKFLTTVNFKSFLTKYPSAAGGWYMLANGTANQSYVQLLSILGTNTDPTLSPVGAASEKCLLAFSTPSGGPGVSYKNASGGTSQIEKRNGASTTIAKTAIGCIADGTSNQNFEMYGAFIHQGALTSQNLTDIAAHWGI